MNLAGTQKINKCIVDDHIKILNEFYENPDMKSHLMTTVVQNTEKIPTFRSKTINCRRTQDF